MQDVDIKKGVGCIMGNVGYNVFILLSELD